MSTKDMSSSIVGCCGEAITGEDVFIEEVLIPIYCNESKNEKDRGFMILAEQDGTFYCRKEKICPSSGCPYKSSIDKPVSSQ